MDQPIRSILAAKGNDTHALGPDTTVAEAVHVMNRHNVGAVLVLDPDEHLLGIFTERDVLRRVIDGDLDHGRTVLSEVMTSNVATVSPGTTVGQALKLIDRLGARHLPVMEGDRVVGMISLRDLTSSLVADRDHQIAELTEYISGHY